MYRVAFRNLKINVCLIFSIYLFSFFQIRECFAYECATDNILDERVHGMIRSMEW